MSNGKNNSDSLAKKDNNDKGTGFNKRGGGWRSKPHSINMMERYEQKRAKRPSKSIRGGY